MTDVTRPTPRYIRGPGGTVLDISKDESNPQWLYPKRWDRYAKQTTTPALRIVGPFSVRTREGDITCEDGWLALDSGGWPYPIAADEFDRIYARTATAEAAALAAFRALGGDGWWRAPDGTTYTTAGLAAALAATPEEER